MSTEENATPEPRPPLYKTIEVAWSKLAETLNTEAEAGYHVAHDLFRSVHDPNVFTVLLHWNESAIADAVRQRALNMMSDLLDAAPAYIENLLAGQSATLPDLAKSPPLPDWAKSPPAPPAEAPAAEAPPAGAPAAP